MKLSTLFTFIILAASFACNDADPVKQTVGAEDVDLIVDKLIFEGSTENGAPPPPNNTNTLAITNLPAGISVTYDNFLFLPINVHATDGFDGIYIQLSNEHDNVSKSYFDIPLGTDSSVMIKFQIPADISPGLFFMNVSAYKGENVSEVHTIPVEIVHPQKGCDGSGKNFHSGETLFTNRTYSFDESVFPVDNFNNIVPQRLTFKTIVDAGAQRIDIYVDKHWAGGTGNPLEFGEAPAAVHCDDDDLTEKGFSSETNYLTFEVRPDQRIDVLVTSCLGVSAWDYGFTCPRK